MKKIIRKYCSECGSELQWEQDYAEKCEAGRNGYVTWNFSKFNSHTGERQIAGWWECPKKRWWNSHDKSDAELV